MKFQEDTMSKTSSKPINRDVTGAELAAIAGDYSPATISRLTKSGVLHRNKAGRYDIAESLQAIIAHEQRRLHEGTHNDPVLAPLRAKLLRKRIALMDHQLNVETGKVHAKDGCTAARIVVYSGMRQVLVSMPSRVSSAVPEFGIKLREILEGEVDLLISQLRGILDADLRLYCPKCGTEFETLRAIILAQTRPPDSKFLGETQNTVEQKQEEQKNDH
jgi:hypothetical protein